MSHLTQTIIKSILILLKYTILGPIWGQNGVLDRNLAEDKW